ncbi:hypothetical protein RB195_003519 [Necator americanus]|uniref:Uncharacterized protein n=1 Tax=Necator americanus TaxID=51031 RepID=A0ABR1DNY5_NECAM
MTCGGQPMCQDERLGEEQGGLEPPIFGADSGTTHRLGYTRPYQILNARNQEPHGQSQSLYTVILKGGPHCRQWWGDATRDLAAQICSGKH